MKISRAAALATIALAAVSIDAAVVRGFGPANCVSLSRSSAGTCVLRTSCAGQDLSSFDISFECVDGAGRETHSMGRGSFDEQEEYDTDIKCQECLAPQSKAPIAHTSVAKQPVATGVSLAAVSISREVGKVHGSPAKVEEPPPKAEWYGPEECVGVWKDDKSGTCVMQTDCDKDTQTNVYEFGLICIKDAEMTRHLFGMDSFAHKETFSTLIPCDECRALDEYMDGNKAVNALTNMVKGMKDDMVGVTGDVVKLKAEVFPKAPSPAPAAAAPAPASAKPAKFMAVAKDAQASPPQPPSPQKVPEPQQVQPVQQPSMVKHEEVNVEGGAQQLASSLGKDVTANDHEVVQHLKKKASQIDPAAASEQPSTLEILSEAVKGAQADGIVAQGTAQGLLKKVSQKLPEGHAMRLNLERDAQSPIQGTQLKLVVAPVTQQSQASPQIEYVEDKTPAQYDDADDDDDGDANDDDGFR